MVDHLRMAFVVIKTFRRSQKHERAGDEVKGGVALVAYPRLMLPYPYLLITTPRSPEFLCISDPSHPDTRSETPTVLLYHLAIDR
ncbi:hypothetical protein PVAG01_05182 [Phlyctema vagabunda]|uniref:Uncharacterized protein n=1 Tax=Phlyctema vagabunda TaxID=108571 RepID=A0ABR4PJC2_9HELO